MKGRTPESILRQAIKYHLDRANKLQAALDFLESKKREIPNKYVKHGTYQYLVINFLKENEGEQSTADIVKYVQGFFSDKKIDRNTIQDALANKAITKIRYGYYKLSSSGH